MTIKFKLKMIKLNLKLKIARYYLLLYEYVKMCYFRAILMWNIQSRFLKAIAPTADPFLGYTGHYFNLYYVIYYD
jgi:hypothetical protein